MGNVKGRRRRKRQKWTRRKKHNNVHDKKKEVDPTFQFLDSIYTGKYEGGAGAYAGKDAIRRVIQRDGSHKVSEKKLENYLQSKESYSTHKLARKIYPTKSYNTGGVNILHQIDLMDLQNLSTYNQSIRFLLCTIDCFSKLARVRALKDKTGKSVLKALKSIYDDIDKPVRIESDEGKEFTGALVQNYLKENDIEFIIPRGKTKAGIIERFIRSLRLRLNRYLSENNTLVYIDQLQNLVQGYNATYHRAVGVAPKDVSEKNAHEIYMRLYGDPSLPETYRLPKVKFHYKPNDTVRVSLVKGPFEKGSSQSFSTEVFRVKERLGNQRPVQYHLESLDGEPILGKFTAHELTPAKFDPHQYYPIEKILGEKNVNGKKYVEVKWIGWHKTGLVDASQIIDVKSKPHSPR